MKNITKMFTVLLTTAFLLSASMLADEITIKSNPHCDMCKGKIEKGLNKVDGVNKTNVDVAAKTVTVDYNAEKTNAASLMKEIEGMGYTASLDDGNKSDVKKDGSCCKSDKKCKTDKDCGDKKSGDKCCKSDTKADSNCSKDKK